MDTPRTARRGGGGAFFWGTLIGGVAGAIVALWRAPRSGRATRTMIEAQVRRRVEGESVADALREGKAEARRLNRQK